MGKYYDKDYQTCQNRWIYKSFFTTLNPGYNRNLLNYKILSKLDQGKGVDVESLFLISTWLGTSLSSTPDGTCLEETGISNKLITNGAKLIILFTIKLT